MPEPGGPPAGPSVPVAPTSTPSRRPRRAAVRAAAIAVVVAAVVVVGLFAAGVLPLGSSSSGPAIPFSQARTDAEGAAASTLGGSWVANAAVAIDGRAASTVPVNLSGEIGSGCVLKALPGTTLPSTLSVPAYSGSFSSGLSPFWLVAVSDPSTKEVVLVEVLDGQSAPVAQLTGSSCLSSGLAAEPLPATAIDSPKVAAAAWSDFGQAFVADEPALTVLVMAASEKGVSVAGVDYSNIWGFSYAPCDPFSGGSVHADGVVGALNLTTGSLIEDVSGVPVDCPS